VEEYGEQYPNFILIAVAIAGIDSVPWARGGCGQGG
jgi:hypothetical protein